jgi:prevent-host-death family protein
MPKPPKLSEDIQPLSEFRANTARFLRHVRATRRPLVLTQRGRGTAVLLDIHEYERLLDRAELAEEIRIAEAQLDRGEGVPHDVAREQILSLLGE